MKLAASDSWKTHESHEKSIFGKKRKTTKYEIYV